METEYRYFNSAVDDFFDLVHEIASRSTVTRVCDVGGGATPLLSPDAVTRHRLDYTVLDISAEELGKAPDSYATLQADIASPDLDTGTTYDLVFSRMLLEHVKDPVVVHRNLLRLLRPGGFAVHLFPTLYAPPFVVNRVLPEATSRRFLLAFFPHRHPDGPYGKFPAYYRWCRGPTDSQIGRYHKAGFAVDRFIAYFGHWYYKRIPPLEAMQRTIAEALVRRPIRAITTYGIVVLRKPREL